MLGPDFGSYTSVFKVGLFGLYAAKVGLANSTYQKWVLIGPNMNTRVVKTQHEYKSSEDPTWIQQ